MRKQISVLCLTVLGSVAIQGPSFADKETWFHKWDANKDGKWSWQEFRRANHEWYKINNGVVQDNDKELYHRFKELDKSNDKFVTPDELVGFHEEWTK